jgi:crossover junction endodeoxyribonuclease RuvC
VVSPRRVTVRHTGTGPKVIGVDPSLTSTGIADHTGKVRLVRCSTLPKGSKPGVRMGRIERIVNEVQAAVEAARSVELVVIEGYAYNVGAGAVAQAELGGILRWHLWCQGVAVVELGPGTLKKFATGDGSAKKTAMVIAARERLGHETVSDDEADAIWLRVAGLALLGHDMTGIPIAQVRGLAKAVTR